MSILPMKLLKMSMSNVQPYAYWTEPTGHPFYDDGGYPYQWTVTLTVTPQSHSSVDTTTWFQYDGNDVKVGDWIVTTSGGIANKIVDITSQNGGEVICIVEDEERLNIMSDPTLSGIGIGNEGTGYIFELGPDGLPIFGPSEAFYMPITTQTDIISRFIYRNATRDYVRVYQPDHGMAKGDVIRPDPDNAGEYLKVLADANVDYTVGVVTSVNIPGSEWFTFRPAGTIVYDVDLTGNNGDLFYVDPTTPGALTTTKPTEHAKPVYIRLETSNKAVLLDRNTIEAGGAGGSVTKTYEPDEVSEGQTSFTLPGDAVEVITMGINGIENTDWTFDSLTKELVHDPLATGYGVSSDDEILFVYRT